MRRSRGWRSGGRNWNPGLLFKFHSFCSLIKSIGAWGCVTMLAPGIFSCAPRNKEFPVRPSRPIARALPVVLSDSELNRSYLDTVSDLQRLNAEMKAANNVRNFEMVREKAVEGLLKARSARQIAEKIQDGDLRGRRLAAIDMTIGDLERLVIITSQQ